MVVDCWAFDLASSFEDRWHSRLEQIHSVPFASVAFQVAVPLDEESVLDCRNSLNTLLLNARTFRNANLESEKIETTGRRFVLVYRNFLSLMGHEGEYSLEDRLEAEKQAF